MAINALLRGDFAQAPAGFRDTIEIDPEWTWGYIKLARALALEKKCDEAFAQAEIAERRIAGGVGALSRAWLGATYATCGDTARAREKLAQVGGRLNPRLAANSGYLAILHQMAFPSSAN